MASKLALHKWPLEWRFKFRLKKCVPIFLLLNILSDPFPNGIIIKPFDPIGILSAKLFISWYEIADVFFLSHLYIIPAPLMHKSLPINRFLFE